MRVFLGHSLVVLCALAAFMPAAAAPAGPVPSLSGDWARDFFFFEPKPGLPPPVQAKFRRPDGTLIDDPLIADDSNPILTPRAAAALRNRVALAKEGLALDPHNQCRVEPTPFTLLVQLGLRIVQSKNEVVLVTLSDHQVRHVKMNVPHPAHVVPSWHGDSVGHYEGDSLVVDTIGQKVGPLSVIDFYGTPFTDKLHVIERYRLISGIAARDALQKQDARYFPRGTSNPRGNFDPDLSKPGLQIEVTVEDPAIFTMPWTGLITYRPMGSEWAEIACAENPREYFDNRDAPIPRAETPDF